MIRLIIAFTILQFASLASGQNWPLKIDQQIDQYVVDVFRDKQDRLWFATLEKGAAYYDGQKLSYFTTNDGLISNRVVDFAEDKNGNIWFAHGDLPGVSVYDGESFKQYNEKRGVPGMSSTVYADRDGNIWVGTSSGAFRFDGKKFADINVPKSTATNASFKISLNSVWCISQDRQGNMWFGTDGNGIFKHDGNAFTHFTTANGLLTNNVITMLEDQHGNMWFASIASRQPKVTADGGLTRYDGKSIKGFPNVKGLAQNDIYLLFEDKAGNIWIGSAGVGAYRFDGKDFQLFNKTDRPDLTSAFGLQAMDQDKQGRLWCGFSGGLFRFNGKHFENVTQQALERKK